MFTQVDYRNSLAHRDQYDLYSPEWYKANETVNNIVTQMIRSGSQWMAHELASDIYSSYEIAENMSAENAAEIIAEIEPLKNLLVDNGFGYLLDDLE